MKAKMAVNSLISALLVLQVPLTVRADAVTCAGLFSANVTPVAEPAAPLETLSMEELLKNQLQRASSEHDTKTIDKLKKKLLAYRRLNGIWETTRITQKRMTALGFEMFILMNDLKSISTMYAPGFEFTEKAAVRYLASEAMLKYYRDRLQNGTLNQAEANQLIEVETEKLDLVRAEFLDYADKTMSLAFVLEVMKSSGAFVDVSTLFGSASRTTDVHGNEIIGVTVVPGPPKPVVPILVPTLHPTTPAGPLQVQIEGPKLPAGAQASQHAQGAPGSTQLQTQTQVPNIIVDVNDPSATGPRPPVTPKPPPLPPIETSPAEIKLRAAKVEQIFGKYMQTEAIANLINDTRRAVGSEFLKQRLTYDDLSKLRKRLQPDWNSTAVIVRNLKNEISDERILRAKLLTLGPQAAEIITTWIGTAKPGGKVENLAPLARLAGMVYDDQVRLRNMSTILKVLSLPDPESKFNTLMNGNGDNPYAAKGELITSFIRFTLGRNDWNQIKTFIANSPYSYDKQLNAQFDAYEKDAVQRGPLGPINVAADPIGAVIMSGVVVGGSTLATYKIAPVASSVASGAFSLMDSAWLATQSALSPSNIEAFLHITKAATGN